MTNHDSILRSQDLNAQLFEQGYATLPFLNADEVEKLKEIFWKHHTTKEVEGLYVSSNAKSSEQIQQISDEIQLVFKRAINEHIENGITLGGTFISKPPHQTEPLHPHQDWSIVDESRFRSFTIWVPLMDVDETNGCMYVLPGSHEQVRGYRHLTIPSVFGQIYDLVWEHMKMVPMKAGEAIIFDHALGHGSKPNRSDNIRIASTHSLISPNFEMRFYWNNNGTVEEYEGESDFYNTEEAKVGPGRLKKIRDVDFKMKQLNQEEFNTLVGVETSSAGQQKMKQNWFQRIFG